MGEKGQVKLEYSDGSSFEVVKVTKTHLNGKERSSRLIKDLEVNNLPQIKTRRECWRRLPELRLSPEQGVSVVPSTQDAVLGGFWLVAFLAPAFLLSWLVFRRFVRSPRKPRDSLRDLEAVWQ